MSNSLPETPDCPADVEITEPDPVCVPLIPAPSIPLNDIDDPKNLHVVAVFFNFNRRKNPLENFHRFVKEALELGVTLHVVELVRGNLPFEVTLTSNPRHVQLRTESEFFQKENLINIGVRNAINLYPDLEYIAWIDGDVTFFNKKVAVETMSLLNRHPVVQMWSQSSDLDPDGHPLVYPGEDKAQVCRSFAYCFENDYKFEPSKFGYQWHTGYAWAMRRATWEALGGLYEHTIIGAADNHMAWSFIGQPEKGIHGQASQDYLDHARAWCYRAAAIVDNDIGCVDGLIHHHWHGRKIDRKYVERWSVIVDNAFSPLKDLIHDELGVLHLTNNNPKLRRDIRKYMQSRNDDANTVA